MFIVNAPLIFRSIWAIVRPWLEARTQRKIQVCPSAVQHAVCFKFAGWHGCLYRGRGWYSDVLTASFFVGFCLAFSIQVMNSAM